MISNSRFTSSVISGVLSCQNSFFGSFFFFYFVTLSQKANAVHHLFQGTPMVHAVHLHGRVVPLCKINLPFVQGQKDSLPHHQSSTLNGPPRFS